MSAAHPKQFDAKNGFADGETQCCLNAERVWKESQTVCRPGDTKEKVEK
jgi:hypothetical protein